MTNEETRYVRALKRAHDDYYKAIGELERGIKNLLVAIDKIYSDKD